MREACPGTSAATQPGDPDPAPAPATPDASESSRLGASQLRVLGAIAAAGGAPLTKDQLADLARCSKKTVDRAITRFTRDGTVEVRSRYAPNGGQLANEYVITSFHSLKPNNAPETSDASVRPVSHAQKQGAP